MDGDRWLSGWKAEAGSGLSREAGQQMVGVAYLLLGCLKVTGRRWRLRL